MVSRHAAFSVYWRFVPRLWFSARVNLGIDVQVVFENVGLGSQARGRWEMSFSEVDFRALQLDADILLEEPRKNG